VGQEFTGQTLEVIERPWKRDRFGDLRAVGKYLKGLVFFNSIHTKVEKGE
jgi:hypothetical protein